MYLAKYAILYYLLIDMLGFHMHIARNFYLRTNPSLFTKIIWILVKECYVIIEFLHFLVYLSMITLQIDFKCIVQYISSVTLFFNRTIVENYINVRNKKPFFEYYQGTTSL